MNSSDSVVTTLVNSPDSVATTLVNFSTVGFIVLLGTATVIPIIYELTLLRRDESVQLLRRYPYRLISRLGQTWSIVTLMVTSLLFILTGILSLTFLLFGGNIFIKSALHLSVGIEVILILYVFCILICALPFQKHEVDQIMDYTVVSFEEIDVEK